MKSVFHQKRFQRVVSFLLTLTMLATLLPSFLKPAAAADMEHTVFISEIYGNDVDRNADYSSVKAGVDVMDYIELYNYGSEPVTFSTLYDLRYCTKSAIPTPLAFESETPVIIPANGAAVVWIKRDDLERPDADLPNEAAFRAAFGISQEVPVYATKGQKALSNNADTTVRITVKGSADAIVSTIDYGSFGSAMEGKSYHYQRQEGKSDLIGYGTSTTPSAGRLEVGQAVAKTAPPDEDVLNIDPYDLFISEVYANDIDRSKDGLGVSKNTDDLMDYVEIMNNSAEDIVFGKHFRLELQDKNAGDFTPLSFYGEDDTIVIPAGKPAIFWMKRTTSNATEADFKTAFSQVPAGVKIYPVMYTALGNNSSTLRLVMKSDSTVTSTVSYPTFSTETDQGKSVHYQRTETGKNGLKIWEKFTAPTPGTVSSSQLEYAPASTPEPVDGSPLYISEIYPDDINRADQGYMSDGKVLGDTIDLMDYVEVYNSSSAPIDFNTAYRLTYTCTDPAKLAPEKTLNVLTCSGGSAIIPAHTAAVIWIRRTDLATRLVPYPDEDAFRRGVKMNSPDAPVFYTDNQTALSNVSGVISLYTKDENCLASTYSYSKSLADFGASGTVVHLQPLDKGANMKAYQTAATATPGRVDEAQKTPFHDTGKGTTLELLEKYTGMTTVDEGKDLMIGYKCVDEMGVNSVDVYYRLNGMGSYIKRTSTNFAYRVVGQYYVEIPGDRLLGADYVEYYIEAQNSYRVTSTAPRRIEITNRLEDFNGIRTNVPPSRLLSGDVLLVARDKGNRPITIAVDGQDMSSFPRLEKGAYFTLSYTDLSTGYKNAVTVKNPVTNEDDVLTQIARWFVTMPSKAVFVDGSYFTLKGDGSAEITLTLRAGTKGTPFTEKNMEGIDRDYFLATGFQLELPNGRKIAPNNDVDPNLDYAMGNMGGKNGRDKLDISFTVPAEELTGMAYQWNTRNTSDGEHTLKFYTSDAIEEVPVCVDNTAPVLSLNLEEDQLLTNELALDFEYADASAIDEESLTVRLDGVLLGSPVVNGSDLTEGAHTLTAEVYDVCGNKGTLTMHFRSAVRYPVFGELSQKTGSNSAVLTAALDSNAEGATASFYPGMAYSVGSGITVAHGWGDATGSSVPGGLGTVTAPDGEFPYQIYTVQTNGRAEDTLRVEVKGETNYGVSLRLYALDVRKNTWTPLDTRQTVSGAEAEFVLGGFVENGAVRVLVQGRGAEAAPGTGAPYRNTVRNDYSWDGAGEPEQYDFSIAWTSDTQYYAESFPDQYDGQTEWIVNNRDRLNLRYLVHTGDVVDDFDQDWEWEVGDRNMKRLEDNGIPYGVLGGNHDVGSGNGCFANYWTWFGEHRFKDSSVYGGAYQNNLGHYDLVTADGVELLFVYMSWDVYDEEINWINEVLRKYPDRKAFLCFHNYIVASTAELDYTGLRVQREVVAANPNVLGVLGGHYHGSAIHITAFDDDKDGTNDRLVYQMCTDYQSGEMGGLAYLKMMYFDLANGKIYINSYSPTKKDFNYYDTPKLDSYPGGTKRTQLDIFEMDVDFSVPEQRTLTTAGVTAELYGSTAIAAVTATGDSATATYTGLSGEQSYGWYAVAQNSLGLRTRSRLQGFTTTRPAASDDSDPSHSGASSAETVKNGDGSITRTETDKKTGTITQTTTYPDNTRIIAIMPKDGAPTIDVTFPENKNSVTVTIPMAQKPAPGQVAVIVKADGTREIVKSSVAAESGLRVTLTEGARLEIADNSKRFTDVPTDDWAAGAVQFVSSRELFNGTAANIFRPADKMTRGMLVTVLARLAGQDTTKGGIWYSVGMGWAKNTGVSDGTSPEADITRESLAVMLYRYAKAGKTDGNALSAAPDADLVSDWAVAAMGWAVEKGILIGNNAGELNPTGAASRAEVASILTRFITQLAK